MILLSCGLTEDIKWGKPCYSVNGTNLFVIQGFKEYFALLFFKGILLKDPDNILVKTGENTRVGRQARFKNVQEIIELEPILKKYIHQAIGWNEVLTVNAPMAVPFWKRRSGWPSPSTSAA